MRLKVLHIIIVVLTSLTTMAQTDDYVLEKDSLKVRDKLEYQFSIGAGFGYSSNAGDFFSTYYRPSISYDVSSRFRLIVGLTYINSSVNNYPVFSDYYYQLFNGNISQYYTYVAGEYKINERLTVGGSIFYDFSKYEDFAGNTYQNNNGLNSIGYSGYFKYKVKDGLSIMGEVRINDRNPMGNRFMGATEYSFFGR